MVMRGQERYRSRRHNTTIVSTFIRRCAMDHPVVLITGALTGVGRATALAFAREGARLVVSGRRDGAGQTLAAELRALGAEVEYVHADVRHETDVSRLVDQVVERFGRLDSAVNNAGTEGQLGPVRQTAGHTRRDRPNDPLPRR